MRQLPNAAQLQLYVVGALWIITCQCNTQVIVETKYGKVLGKTKTYSDIDAPFKAVNKFLGIPYAAPPVGELRFRPPQPPSSWKSNVYNATQFGNVCLQPYTKQNIIFNKNFWPEFTSNDYSDNCLYLNIFTPQRNDSGLNSTGFPVMLYIHGGGYEAGSPVTQPGDLLALRGVVVVTIQYRLSAFGFVTTGDSAAPGNYGMLDQVEAMKWVKENIAAFGGNPSRVTIFGESAGGSSVSLHLLSPLSRGLFHQAISISGVDFSPFSYTTLTEAINFTKLIAKNLSCPTKDSSKMIKCLRAVHSSKIPVDAFNCWRPVIDKNFLIGPPRELRLRRQFTKVPFMAGFTMNEGSYFLRPKSKLSYADFRNEIKWAFKMVRNYRVGLPGKGIVNELIADALQFQYTPRPFDDDISLLKQKLYDVLTDYSFAAPTHAVLSMHTESAAGYMYLFQHSSRSREPPHMKHLDDLPYIFGLPLINFKDKFNISNVREFDDADRNVSDTIVTMFTNFAKYGHPTPKSSRSTTWEAFNSTKKGYLRIKIQPEMAENFEPERMAFWNEFYPKLLNLSFKAEAETETCVSAAATTIQQALHPGMAVIPVLISIWLRMCRGG